MKKEIHPNDYRLVVFQDVSCDYTFITRSTVKTSETIKWEDGKEYPLYKLEISDKSHPYFTGKQNLVDSAGRIEKFNRKYKISDKEDQVSTEEEGPTMESAVESVEAKKEIPFEEIMSSDEPAKEGTTAEILEEIVETKKKIPSKDKEPPKKG